MNVTARSLLHSLFNSTMQRFKKNQLTVMNWDTLSLDINAIKNLLKMSAIDAYPKSFNSPGVFYSKAVV